MPGQLRMLNGFARRDPELYLLAGVMSAAVGGIGYWFGRSAGTAEQYGKHEGRVGLPWNNAKSEARKYEDSAQRKLNDGMEIMNDTRDSIKQRSSQGLQDARNILATKSEEAKEKSSELMDKSSAAFDDAVDKVADKSHSLIDRLAGRK